MAEIDIKKGNQVTQNKTKAEKGLCFASDTGAVREPKPSSKLSASAVPGANWASPWDTESSLKDKVLLHPFF